MARKRKVERGPQVKVFQRETVILAVPDPTVMSDEEWEALVAEGKKAKEDQTFDGETREIVVAKQVLEKYRQRGPRPVPTTEKTWECNSGCYCCAEWEAERATVHIHKTEAERANKELASAYNRIKMAQRRFRALGKLRLLGSTQAREVEQIMDPENKRWHKPDKVG